MLGSLKETAEHRHERLVEFSERYPDVWELAETFVVSARGLLTACLPHANTGFQLTTAHLCWRTVYDYQESSFFMLVNSMPDQGYALLRMAAELARDVARFSESDANFEMWQKRLKPRSYKHYKNTFRFDDYDVIEREVHSLYKLTSQWGVHGHQTGDMFRRNVEFLPDGEHVTVSSTYVDVLDSLQVWFHSFFSLQRLAGRGFEDFLKRTNDSTYRASLKVEVASAEVLQKFRESVEELKKDAQAN